MGKTQVNDNASKTDRRGFLKLAGVSAVGGGVALVAGTSAKAEQIQKSGSGYRETDHVRTYYETARF